MYRFREPISRRIVTRGFHILCLCDPAGEQEECLGRSSIRSLLIAFCANHQVPTGHGKTAKKVAELSD